MKPHVLVVDDDLHDAESVSATLTVDAGAFAAMTKAMAVERVVETALAAGAVTT